MEAQLYELKRADLTEIRGAAQGVTSIDPISLLDAYVGTEDGSTERRAAIRSIVPLGVTYQGIHEGIISIEGLVRDREVQGAAEMYKAAVGRFDDPNLKTIAASAYLATVGNGNHTVADWQGVLSEDPTLALDHQDSTLQKYAIRTRNDPLASGVEQLAANIIALRSYHSGPTETIERGIATALEQDPTMRGFVLNAIEEYTTNGQDAQARVAIKGAMHYASLTDKRAGEEFVAEIIDATKPELMVTSLSGMLRVMQQRDI
ncbi:TPA: hypothetical protein HA278_08280 [Candidatus Woesearchaeota archaeon]|nr:hypothetical protein [archaeon]HIJ12029.1 hypothetical protein [Candidatus Woesearchaeota archaeon]